MKTQSMKYLFLLFSYFCLSQNIISQYNITGHVLDSTNNNLLEFATIRLLQKDSVFVSGTTTNHEGKFQIKDLKSCSYILSVRSLGYNTLYKPIQVKNQDIELETIYLSHDSRVLSEVQVVADHFIKRKDGLLIFPEKEQLKFAGSGYDVLYNIMIPGLNVDKSTGKITKMGLEVSIYIDGKKSEYHEIQGLQPEEIEKIEYIDIPSGKYIQDDVVINVIMRKRTTGGYFSIDGKQNAGYLKGDYNVTSQLIHQGINYSFFGGYAMEKYNNKGSFFKENFIFPQSTFNRINTTSNDLHKSNNQYAQLNIKSSDSIKSIAGKVSFLRNKVPENFKKNKIFYSDLNNGEMESISRNEEQSLAPSVELYGSFNLPQNQYLETTLSGTYTRNKYNRSYHENSFNTYTNVTEDFYNARVNANYTKQLKNGNSFAASVYDDYRLSTSKYDGNYLSSQQLWTNEAILFGGYTHIFGQKWIVMLRPGLSWLKYHLKDEKGVNQVSPRLTTMLRYNPSAMHQLSLQVNIGNNFPSINTLNSVDQTIDSILIKRGNPNLDLTKIYNIAFMYSLFTKKFNIQTMLIHNIFTDMTTPDYYTEGNKMISTFRSDERLKQYIGVVAGSWNALESLQLKTELAIIHSNFDKAFKASHTTYRASFDLNYYWRNFMVNLFVKAKEKTLTNDRVLEDQYTSYGGNIKWNLKRWLVEVGTSNPFSDRNNIEKKFDGSNYSYFDKMYNKTFQRTGYLKVAYRFGFGKKYTPDNSDVDRNINSAILKN